MIKKIIKYTKEMLYYNIIIPKKFNNIYESIGNYSISSIEGTASELVNTTKSIGRFGDGEISWMFNIQNHPEHFEHTSKLLSDKLFDVFNSNSSEFMVGVPGIIKDINEMPYTTGAKNFWKMYIVCRHKLIKKSFDLNKKYWDTNVTRPYMDFNERCIADNTFKALKKVWENKDILIVEGNESRVGVDDDLLKNANIVKRIECPTINAFESYDSILAHSLKFLENNKNFITLISLGPTATILAYDLFKSGHRAIDIGNIDVEYEWYLMGAKEKVNLPYKYVNEVKDGHSALDSLKPEYKKEIVYRIFE